MSKSIYIVTEEFEEELDAFNDPTYRIIAAEEDEEEAFRIALEYIGGKGDVFVSEYNLDGFGKDISADEAIEAYDGSCLCIDCGDCEEEFIEPSGVWGESEIMAYLGFNDNSCLLHEITNPITVHTYGTVYNGKAYRLEIVEEVQVWSNGEKGLVYSAWLSGEGFGVKTFLEGTMAKDWMGVNDFANALSDSLGDDIEHYEEELAEQEEAFQRKFFCESEV